jgi:mannosylglycerate hydrolase
MPAGGRHTLTRKEFLSLTTKGAIGLALARPRLADAQDGAASPLVAHVVSHTHWDRAWYLPLEPSRLRLARLMRKLLGLLEADRSYKFCLDGQTILLEDFLGLFPDERPRVERVVRRRQLAVGPFYVQPDQWLVSGESLIRNMMIGIRQAAELGHVQREGYLADNFGHPAQLPQLLQGFGIRSLLTAASRGIAAEQLKRGRVQRWLAPDGESDVVAYFFADNYANFYYWGFDNFNPAAYPHLPPDAREWSPAIARKQLAEVVLGYQGAAGGTRAAELNTRQLFLGNGVDHQEAQPYISRVIEELSRAQKEVRLVHSSCEELVDAVLAERRELPELRGPLGDDKLYGTATSRIYLIQDYARLAGVTESLTEPLLSLAAVFAAGHRVFREPQHLGFTFNVGQNWPELPEYPGRQMDYLWRLILQNAPHDEICGCSVDAVHRQMEDRTERAAELTSALWNDALLLLAGRLLEQEADGALPRLVVFNPHPFACRETLEVELDLPGVADATTIGVVDRDGRPVPAVVGRAEAVRYPRFDGNDFNKDMMLEGSRVALALCPLLPPCSLSVFSVEAGGPTSAPAVASPLRPTVAARGGVVEIENADGRVSIYENGTFDILDKETGHSQRGLGRMEDVEDVGDAYEFVRLDPPPRPVTSDAAAGRLHVVSHDEISTVVEVTLDLELPAALETSRQARSSSTVTSPLVLRFEVPHQRRGGRLTLELENRARDHHLRMYFPTGIETGEIAYDSKFDLATYPLGYAKARVDSTVIARSGDRAFGLVLDCPTLVDSRADARGAVELGWTLVRSIDHVNAGIPTRYWRADEAQCLRKMTRRLEWCTGTPAAVVRDCLQRRRTLLVPPAVLGVTPSSRNRYLDAEHTTLPLRPGSLLEVEGEGLHLSAWKRAEDGTGWVVRLYSLAEGKTGCRLRTALPVDEARAADLGEHPRERLSGTASAGFTFEMRPKEIKTLVLRLDRELLKASRARKPAAV